MSDLKVEHVAQGRGDKGVALGELLESLEIDESRVAYVGDDVLDLPALRTAGVAITVDSGHPLVKTEVDWVTTRRGGEGAVREIADAILDARGSLSAAVDKLLT
jgi:3-deoxy-D-manno-octulosonate 8-phosphate phosphatase (KDO 8-P phosphatase)